MGVREGRLQLRSSEYAVTLTYDGDGKPFYIPPNVYILSMMNTADRSLALVDYSLRRRFAFEELAPAFGTDDFRDYLQEIGLDLSLINVIDERMEALNEEIRDDNELGRGFQIGHSFFVPGDDDELSEDWFEHVVYTQIRPLLQEYWFDTPERVERAVSRLLGHQVLRRSPRGPAWSRQATLKQSLSASGLSAESASDQAEGSASRGYPAISRGRHPVGCRHPSGGLSHPGTNH